MPLGNAHSAAFDGAKNVTGADCASSLCNPAWVINCVIIENCGLPASEDIASAEDTCPQPQLFPHPQLEPQPLLEPYPQLEEPHPQLEPHEEQAEHAVGVQLDGTSTVLMKCTTPLQARKFTQVVLLLHGPYNTIFVLLHFPHTVRGSPDIMPSVFRCEISVACKLPLAI